MELPILTGAEASGKLSDAVFKAIEELLEGEVLAVYMRNATTDASKVIVEFAEKISLSTAPQNALVDFNPGDERFSQRARRTWITADRAYAEKLFGVKIPEDEAMVEIVKKVPKVSENEEYRIRVIEFLETDLSDEQKEYKDNYLKQIPSTGQFFYAKGTNVRVCSQTRLIKWTPGKEVPHILIEGEYKSPISVGAALQGTASQQLSGTFAK